MKPFSLPKKKKLTTNSQFKAVLERKNRASSGLIVLYMAKNELEYARLGVSVGKSCGNAVVRNRLKRLFREVFRQNQGQIPAGFDYLIIVSTSRTNNAKPSDFNFQSVKMSFLKLVGKIIDKIE